MNLVLSWDLLAVVIFAAVLCFSLILRTPRTIKIIIATYLGSLTADSLGNLFDRTFLASDQFVSGLRLFNLDGGEETLVIAKIIFFLLVVVLISSKGAFEVAVSRPVRASLATSVNVVFGFLAAGLIVSTLLVYISGLSFTQAATLGSNITGLYQDSALVQLMVNYHDLWFSLPALALIGWSIFAGQLEED